MRYLLDVNAVIAAVWKNHPDHSKADAWVQGKSLVTCPLSELGFLRVSTNPKALRSDMATARLLLKGFIEKHQAQFIEDDLPALQSSAQRSEQVTDCYLADLAASKGMKLATLDTDIVHHSAEVIR